ncbi:rRNA adenine N(6)-methyltransferase [Hordeum vulgare]|nr:rRNA adenine N(6)-methyltransferase [Hordeum vulgare]
MPRSFPQARRLLGGMGFEKRDAYFFKQMGKGMLCTYGLLAAAWLWNDTSPLGWWTLKPRPKVGTMAGDPWLRQVPPFVLLQDSIEYNELIDSELPVDNVSGFLTVSYDIS